MSQAWLRVATLAPLVAQAEQAGRDWMEVAERVRFDAMRSRKRQQQFLAGHWLVRCLAADAVGGSAADFALETTTAGAPRLRETRTGAIHSVSISHSGDWVAVALAPFAIGVDIECGGKSRDWLALAEVFCSARELAQLRSLPEPERAHLFHRLWTAKEAFGKRDGQGLKLEEARRQSLQSCAAEVAELWCWPFAGGSLALAGSAGMTVQADAEVQAALAGAYRMETD